MDLREHDLPSIRNLRQYELAEKLGRFGHWYWAVGGDRVEWSPEVQHLFGLTDGQMGGALSEALSILPEAGQTELSALIRCSVIEQKGFSLDVDYDHPDGAPRHFHLVGECEVGDDGRTTGILGVIQDATEDHRLARELAYATERQRDFVEMSLDWLWEMGPDLRFSYVSHQLEAALGAKKEEIIGLTRLELIGDEELSLEMEMHLAWLDQHKPFQDFRFWLIGKDGVRKCISSTGKPIFGSDGAFKGYRGFGRDVTEEEKKHAEFQRANRDLKAANREKSEAMISLQQANSLLEEQAEAMLQVQAEIQHTALHDPLTGIANRRFLDERMGELSAACHRSGDWLAVLHIDLDRFKQINDTAGHAAGDALLVSVASILKENVRAEDFVARIGGDEFCIVCTGSGGINMPGQIAERILTQTAIPFPFEGRDYWFGASIGIATARGRQINPSDLLVNADIALYRAKNHGRGRLEYFSTELQAEIIQNKLIADGIRAGLKRDEFIPHYQAQIDAQTMEIAGFEALARWQNPNDGLLPPVAFLGMAEELNVVSDIDRMILEATMADYARWTDAGYRVPRLSVNVSSRRLREVGLIENLKAMNLPRGLLAFELLESVFLDDADETIVWHIDMLKEMGIDVELDDFGSGHASIISLVKLRPDAIKIDRELVHTVTTDPARRDLVRSIIEIGKSLDVRVVAEGVETTDHSKLLRTLGCDVLQGYVFSKPIPAAEVPAFLDDWSAREPEYRSTA